MRDEREVHNFLYGVGSEHCKPGLAARHNVRMIAENIKRVRRKCTRAYVKDGG